MAVGNMFLIVAIVLFIAAAFAVWAPSLALGLACVCMAMMTGVTPWRRT